MFSQFLILILTSSFLVQAQTDEPDLAKEDRFFQIFQKYNSQPTADDKWSQVFTDKKPRIYTVLKKDTLWDVSKVLFADPNFWPKIWSFNTSEILNPHEIRPGWKISFSPGTLSAPPQMSAVQSSTVISQEDRVKVYDVNSLVEFEGVKIPPPLMTRPIAQIPPSIPFYSNAPMFKDKVEFIQSDTSELTKVPSIPLPVVAFDQRPKPVGEVVEFEDGAKFATDTRDVYIRLDEGMGPGVYTTIKKIEKSKYGYVAVYGAEVEAFQKINDSENIYRAKLKKMINVAEIDDQLILGPIPMADVAETSLASEAPLLRIVGGYRSPTDSVFSAYSLVFLNGGTDQGLKGGETLKLYQDPKIRFESSKIKKAFRQVGLVKILRAEASVSTAYILSSKSELREGDLVGILKDEPDFGNAESSADDDLVLE
jgi:hypothetical protein